MKLFRLTLTASALLTAAVFSESHAQMAETGLKKDKSVSKGWDRSVEATTKRKAKTSKNADAVNAAGSVIDGDSDAPSKEQKLIKLQTPPEKYLKTVGTIPGSIKAKGGIIDGTSDGPDALTNEEIKLLTSNSDIVICGKTGEIVGTKEWKKDGKICQRTNFKIGSPRDQLILLAERDKNDPNSPYKLTDEELAILKSGKDVQLSGKTGEIIGLKDWEKRDRQRSRMFGFNKNSPRYMILRHYHADEFHK